MAELTGVLLEGGGSLVVEAGVAGEGAVTVTLYWRQDAPAKG